ncbi:MAG TPA: hypothetical protein VF817_04040 [Patescibacteria group bacterium]
MSDPLLHGGKRIAALENQARQTVYVIKHNHVLFALVSLTILAALMRVWNSQPVFYAHAYGDDEAAGSAVQSPLLTQPNLFDGKQGQKKDMPISVLAAKSAAQEAQQQADSNMGQKISEVVGDTPIKEMVPYIEKRDSRVAAFLVGIAKKESSFGLASPAKNGQDCYNYWGFKSYAGRGDVAGGYACFASPEEAVEKVGDRIQKLTQKNILTPSRMVDTWKCGGSCAGDPGADSWISTVSLYFNKIADSNNG